jgi:hypothetical protein
MKILHNKNFEAYEASVLLKNENSRLNNRFLAYDKKNNTFSIKELNIWDRFCRKVFGAHKDTHLKTIAPKLKISDAKLNTLLFKNFDEEEKVSFFIRDRAPSKYLYNNLEREMIGINNKIRQYAKE